MHQYIYHLYNINKYRHHVFNYSKNHLHRLHPLRKNNSNLFRFFIRFSTHLYIHFHLYSNKFLCHFFLLISNFQYIFRHFKIYIYQTRPLNHLSNHQDIHPCCYNSKFPYHFLDRFIDYLYNDLHHVFL